MFRCILFLVSFCGASLSFGQDAAEGRNPFRTPPAVVKGDAVAVEAVTSLDSFEFNGFMWWNDKLRISVFDAKANKSYWLYDGELNQLGLGFQRFDRKGETVVLTQGSTTKSLSLNRVKIEALKIPTTPTTTTVPPMVTNMNRPPNPGNVETDQEARDRILRVSEEIRRRRAENRQRLEQRAGQGTSK